MEQLQILVLLILKDSAVPEGVKIAKSELFYHVNTYGKKFFLNTTEQSLLFLRDPQ
jgi:hypothetical protein